MAQSNSDTTVSPALSPFSSNSMGTSEISSDEPGDLGSFANVFRALHEFHAPTRPIPVWREQTRTANATATATPTHILSDDDYDHDDSLGDREASALPAFISRSLPSAASPLHNELRIRHLGLENSDESDSLMSELDGMDVDLEGGEIEVEIELMGEEETAAAAPSFELKAAMQFLAEERARYLARREELKGSATPPDGSSSEPRRRRKRKRVKGASVQLKLEDGKLLVTDSDKATHSMSSSPSPEDSSPSASALDSSSPPSLTKHYTIRKKPGLTSLTGSPAPAPVRGLLQLKTLHHSKSSPALPLVLPLSPSTLHPHVARLRSLAHKLARDFAEDATHLADVLPWDHPVEGIVDPRGAIPQPGDTLYHVFVDHSNIIVGFIERLKKRPLQSHANGRKTKVMSFAAFCLIVERGRPITRRCMAASRPLVQPVDSAVDLGYDVSIYDRVVAKEEIGNETTSSPSQSHTTNNSSTNATSGLGINVRFRPMRRKHRHHDSLDLGSTDSDPGTGIAPSARLAPVYPSVTTGVASSPSKRGALTHKRTQSGPPAGQASSLPSTSAAVAMAAGRIRMKEQGVDELLQLKLYQATTHNAPPGGTILLATGDGNAGEFNEEGFLGCVRNALGKGWRVELYAWGDGLSRAWRREFAEEERFKIVHLDRYVEDLVDAV